MKNKTLRIMLPLAVLASFTTGMPAFGMTWEPLQSDSRPTTDDQKNNPADRDLTAKIRKAIMADKTLSMSSHNVKIIAQDGQVTMRGVVPSQAEKDAVLAKANDIAGSGHVTDDISVKAK